MSFSEIILNSFLVRKPLLLLSMLAQVGMLKKDFYLSPNTLDIYFGSLMADQGGASLDLGSGPIPKNPFEAETVFGVDLRENKSNNVIYADFTSGLLPFEDEAFDYVTAYDLLEHIQRVVMVNGETRFPFISLINEVFRILKPGGVFFCIQPCFPARQAFQDPTHVNIMTEDTLYLYFCEPVWARIYGYEGSFRMLKDGWLGSKYFSFMKKSTERPVRDLEFVQMPPNPE
jgi:SAM-dependent methyltransferase